MMANRYRDRSGAGQRTLTYSAAWKTSSRYAKVSRLYPGKPCYKQVKIPAIRTVMIRYLARSCAAAIVMSG